MTQNSLQLEQQKINSLNTDNAKQGKKTQSFPFGLCRICHDTATGVHYGVISCEGCKGFFKRYITQNIFPHCIFEDKCLINTNTRNRCRSCRFNRCLEQGMSLDSIKMGRIPKKIREKALRKQQKCQEKNLNKQINNLTISLNHNYDLSLLSLPTIFYSSSLFSNSIIKFNNNNNSSISNNTILTVTKYISIINENTLIDYLYNCKLQYSKNILHIIKYIYPKLCQPFLIYELDFQLMSFFRYLRWKMFCVYFQHTIELRKLIQRMFRIINLNEYSDNNITHEQMWIGLQSSISKSVRSLFDFAQDTPGLNELNSTDFTRIMNNRIFDFWIILNYPLFYKNESYLMTPNGLQYSRRFMNKFIGKITTDALHEFCENLHGLNITQIEHSLIIPIVICQSDQQLIESETVHMIKHCYMYALYIQLCTTKTEDQAKILFDNILQTINRISFLNELGKKNIGEIVLDKTS